ncbi:MAG TPA: tetratricopeptide repeat protein [Tepidisphaeraceae bacterium]
MTRPELIPMLQQALAQHQRGNLAFAEQVYRQLLHHDPRDANGLGLLGLLMHQRGQNQQAVELLLQAIKIHPTPDHYVNLSQAFRALGMYSDALAACERVAGMDPGAPEVWNNLGTALCDVGRFEEAVPKFEQAIRLKPAYAKAKMNLGHALVNVGKYADAEKVLEDLVKLAPREPEAWNVYATALLRQQKLSQAEAALRRCADLDPGRAATWSDLGHIVARQERWEDAVALYRKAIDLDPSLAAAHNNLSNALESLGRYEEAEAAVRRAIELSPHYGVAFFNFARQCSNSARFKQVEELARRVLALHPEIAIAHVMLATALQQEGRVEEAQEEIAKSLAKNSGDPKFCTDIESTRISMMNYSTRYSPQEIFDEHVRWGEKHADPLFHRMSRRNDRDPHRRLRIAYISPDFRQHSVAHFLEPLLAAHDHEQFEIYGYCDVANPDRMTRRFQSLCDVWRETSSLTDEALAAMIHGDVIDIAVECAGHTAGYRLLAMARKPAPVQISYVGYANTTGVRAIDYRFTDEHVEPPGEADRLSTEKLIRLGTPYQVFKPSEIAPEPGELPALAAGRITFGSFNALIKVGRESVNLWSKVLRALPDSVMFIKARGLAEPEMRQHLLDWFAGEGIEPGRLTIVGHDQTGEEHLARYGQVDVILDTFPFQGTTMTCEALWMGVPVLSRVGETHASRVGLSLLTAVGLGHLAADSDGSYLSAARQLSSNLAQLAQLRRELRSRMRNSALCDGQRLAREVEAAFRRVWQTWCQSDEDAREWELKSWMSPEKD